MQLDPPMALRTEIRILSDGASLSGSDLSSASRNVGPAAGSGHRDTHTAGACGVAAVEEAGEKTPVLAASQGSGAEAPDDDTDDLIDASSFMLDDDDVTDAIDLMETSWRTMRSILLYVKMQPARRRLLQNHVTDLQGFLEQFVDLHIDDSEREEPPSGWRPRREM